LEACLISHPKSLEVSGRVITVIFTVSSNPAKIIYRRVKGIHLGKLVIFRCAKEVAECWLEIDIIQIVGAVCKKVALCLFLVRY